MKHFEYATYQKSFQRLGLGLALIALAGMLTESAKASHILSERVYWPISVFILKVISKITGILPFSLAEFCLYALLLFLPCVIVRYILRSINSGGWLKRGISIVTTAALLLGSFSLYFQLSWGLTYYRYSLQDRMGLAVQYRPSYQLNTAVGALIADMNSTVSKVERDGSGVMMELSFEELAEKTETAFEYYTQSNWAGVKKVTASKLMSYTNITGIFVAFTGESNVNANNTTAALPFVMAHEMAHRYGIAPEDEANFFAFLVCKESKDPVLRYSAYFTAMQYMLGALYDADEAAYNVQWEKIDPLIIHDFNKYSEHWNQYAGTASELAEKVNNSYLRAQGQKEGVQSYGRITDLLIAYYIND